MRTEDETNGAPRSAERAVPPHALRAHAPKLHSLQYLRAFAALAVVYYHCATQHAPYRPFLYGTGEFGVDVFFVLSGFLMVYIVRARDTPLTFMHRRAARIVPLYWFFTSLMALALLIAPGVARTVTLDVETLVKSLLFIPFSGDGSTTWVFPLLVPGWTLNYEMYFYAVFAASLLLATRLRTAFVAAALVATVLVASRVPFESAVATFYSNTIVFEFVLGMSLARAASHGIGIGIGAGVARATMVVAAVLLVVETPLPRVLDSGLPAALLLIGALHARLPAVRLPELLGDASYAIYLSHWFTLGVLRLVLPRFLGEGAWGAVGFVVLALPICTIAGVVAHILVERPLTRLFRPRAIPSSTATSPPPL